MTENAPTHTADTETTNTDSTAERLKSYVERVERLEEDKSNIQEDIKELYGAIKGDGFDVPIFKKLIAIRKIEAAKRQEMDEVLDLYQRAIGMIP